MHQICVRMNEKARYLSRDTGQGDWSQGRVGQNHCVCLGAFALHAARKKGEALDIQCDAIPAVALTSNYVGKWATWNNATQFNQIQDGIVRLVETCRSNAPNSSQREHLDRLACRMVDDMKRNLPQSQSEHFSANVSEKIGDALGCGKTPATSLVQVEPIEPGMLHTHYDTIFSSYGGNRNAAGHLWATHILERKALLTGQELRQLFSEYCPVSGSPVRYGRKPYAYSLDHASGKLGFPEDAGGQNVAVHHCCNPCVCDLIDCAQVETVQLPVRGGALESFDMLVMDDPCKDQKDGILVKEAPAVICKNGGLRGATKTDSGKVIIGMVHRGENAREALHEPGKQQCEHRARNKYQNGMGTIFRKVCGLR